MGDKMKQKEGWVQMGPWICREPVPIFMEGPFTDCIQCNECSFQYSCCIDTKTKMKFIQTHPQGFGKMNDLLWLGDDGECPLYFFCGR
jgi:hypothetical protein